MRWNNVTFRIAFKVISSCSRPEMQATVQKAVTAVESTPTRCLLRPVATFVYCTVLTAGSSPQTADANKEIANFSSFTSYQVQLVFIFPFQDL